MDVAVLGASGSISACVLCFSLANPTTIVMVYGLLPVPAALLGAGYVAADLYGAFDGGGNLVSDGGGAGVAHFPRLAGAACGAIYFLLAARRGRRGRFR